MENTAIVQADRALSEPLSAVVYVIAGMPGRLGNCEPRFAQSQIWVRVPLILRSRHLAVERSMQVLTWVDGGAEQVA